MLELPRGTQAPSTARHAIRERYAGALSDENLLRAVLLASELVTNAVLHGTGAITMRCRLDDKRLRVEVLDEGSGFEHRSDPAPREHNHIRGLAIVSLLASSWGSRADRTLVWFELNRRGPCGGRAIGLVPDS
jgi:anti-sigma regulatory factor (Ser/Thr protein kinase)